MRTLILHSRGKYVVPSGDWVLYLDLEHYYKLVLLEYNRIMNFIYPHH